MLRMKALLVALPPALTLLFVKLYATPMPLTDEWLFLRAVISLERASSMSEIWASLPFKIYDHHVIVPFLFYWPIAEVSNFDSRALICLTMIAYGVILLVFRFSMLKSTFASIPVALILFSPSHFMTFLWGFTFTFALSIVFPVLGLAIFNRLGKATSSVKATAIIASGISLCTIGTLSSAGGFFGFPAALVLIWSKQIRRRTRIIASSAVSLIGMTLYFTLFHDPGRQVVFGLREALFTFTAFGSAIWGSPVGLTEFSLNAASLTRIMLITIMVLILIRAAIGGQLSTIAFPLSLFLFSLLAVTAIAVSRPYLGNWHIQYALPGVSAVYTAAFVLWQSDRTAKSRTLCIVSGVILTATIAAYYTGFSRRGPEYNAYVRSIESYAVTYFLVPYQPKPFPPTGGWDLDATMVGFLKARGHSVFKSPRVSAPDRE